MYVQSLFLGIIQAILTVLSFLGTIIMMLPGAGKARAAVITFMTDYRGWFVIFFVLPTTPAKEETTSSW